MWNRAAAPSAQWWITLTLFLLFVLLPGPALSTFSGAPLSARGVALFFAVVLVATFTALYPPTRRVRTRWIAVLAVAAAIKLFLAPMVITAGWRGEYWSAATWTTTITSLERQDFFSEHRIRPWRIDRAIAFDGVTWGLDFLNGPIPPRPDRTMPVRRDEYFPMRVVWQGWVQSAPGQPLSMRVTANGYARVTVDGTTIFEGRNPSVRSATAPASRSSQRRIVVEYRKPMNTRPAMIVDGIDARVTPRAVTPAALWRSDWSARAITLLGVVCIAVLFIAFTGAYPRISALALDHIWSNPTKIAAFLFFAVFIALGVARTIPMRHATLLETLFDDPLGYVSESRMILQDGLLMIDPGHPRTPYFFYPLYPYALAGAQLLMGEHFASIIMFNYVCAASLGLFFWALLRNYVRTGAGIVTLLALAFFVNAAALPYATSAFTDNLYLPITFAVVAAAVAALERRSMPLLWLTGVFTAFGAATRPSFLLFVPFFGLLLLLDRAIGDPTRRVFAGAAFAGGFFSGVAPFTLRNWIVSRRFVLLVNSFIMLPLFLTPPEEVPGELTVNGRPPELGESLQMAARILMERPLDVLWLEIRKIGFTLGFTQLGPAGGLTLPRYFVIFTVLFALALWSRRIPRNLRNVMIAFGLSHIAAMVVGAPFSYGYKSIVPLHMVFLLSAAFILPNWGMQREIIPRSVPLEPLNRKRTLSVVLATYNEKDSIRQVILDFFATGVVDEVVVINNNAAEGTSEAVAGTGAREIFERRQGYGAAIRRGLKEATGDLIVVCEPDGTFLARDVHKLLAYADDFDVVYGSRTSQVLVWRGANMGLFLRWGNWVVAKYLEFLYNASSLTDVGCTMRLLHREVAETLEHEFRINGSQFGPEMMILTLRRGYRVIQVPVNYRERVGVSSVTGDPATAFLLGIQMIWLVTSRRFMDIVRPARDG